MSSHHSPHPETGRSSLLQVGVTTNGHWCRLSRRIRREIVARLPREVGGAVEKVGRLRAEEKASGGVKEEQDLNEDGDHVTPSEPVLQLPSFEDPHWPDLLGGFYSSLPPLQAFLRLLSTEYPSFVHEPE